MNHQFVIKFEREKNLLRNVTDESHFPEGMNNPETYFAFEFLMRSEKHKRKLFRYNREHDLDSHIWVYPDLLVEVIRDEVLDWQDKEFAYLTGARWRLNWWEISYYFIFENREKIFNNKRIARLTKEYLQGGSLMIQCPYTLKIHEIF